MQVLFTKDVRGVAKKGDIRNVAAGYFRNFLVPGKLALMASESQVAEASARKKRADEKREKIAARAQDLKKQLEAAKFEISAKVSGKKKLYGSIGEAELVKLVAEKTGIDLDKGNVLMKSHIKQVGEHQVKIKLSDDVSASITIMVSPE